MGIYKKYNYILQVLLITSLFLGLLSLIPNTCTQEAQADEFQDSRSKGKIATSPDNQKGIKMPDMDKLTQNEGEYLLSLARRTIEGRLFKKDIPEEKGDIPDKFLEKRGTFVTLNIHGNLRGCIGHIIPEESLIDGIKINAINAAFGDPRFLPLSKGEWPDVKIEISILTEPKLLAYKDANDLISKLRPGIDGVILTKDYLQATFLPQVWEQLPDKRDFLTHLCLKAGMDGSEWKRGGLTVYTYRVQAFEEH